MSWDVYIFRAPVGVASVDQIRNDYEPPPLGAAADIEQRLRTGVPQIDLRDPAWGHLVGPTWSIELNIGADDPVHSIMLHVRGGGDDVLQPIMKILDAVGGRALDTSTGEFLAGDSADSTGWHAFQQYRDRITRQR